jgi:hypothetical protein
MHLRYKCTGIHSSVTVKCPDLRATLKVAISIAYYRGYTSIYGVEIMR